MPLLDRIICYQCNKEVVSPDGRPVSPCPHCGAWLPSVKWMSKDDVDGFAKSLSENEKTDPKKDR